MNCKNILICLSLCLSPVVVLADALLDIAINIKGNHLSFEKVLVSDRQETALEAEGLTLKCKVLSQDQESVALEFLGITETDGQVVSNPVLIVAYCSDAKIVIGEKEGDQEKERFAINVRASRVE